MKLAERVRSGDKLALARLLTLIENNSQEGQEALSELHASTGAAHRIGVTGAPGTGKSVLVNRLTLHLRAQNNAPLVAIVAVDPTSPFTGGAILGDRIRMRDLSGDSGIFIRSMANRGALGGLSATTSSVVDALDAAGFHKILIETVGTGQAEVDVAGAAHTVLVLEAPGLGDAVQALKAGLLEIADILIVNKSDLPGAENTARALRAALELGSAPTEWITPLLLTSAEKGDGIPELATRIEEHWEHLQDTGGREQRDRARVAREMERLLRYRLINRFREAHPDGAFDRAVERVIERELSPMQAIEELLRDAA
ncbi:MAG: methylmalonyl Co-A mutase-associated GTPase MeaB [Anaerolineales bacterium]